MYLKSLVAVLAAGISAAVVALTGDNHIDNAEWINIAIATAGAAAVFAAPNIPGARYTKAILAVLSAGLATAASFITNGITPSEWAQIAVAGLGAAGVFAVPNSNNEPKVIPPDDKPSVKTGVIGGSGLGLLCVIMIGCGASNIIIGFKAALAASTPFVQSLVTSKTITQAQADLVTTDLGDGINDAQKAATCVDQVNGSGSTGGVKRVALSKCYFAMAQDYRAILERHHIAGNPTLDKISAIFGGAIEALEAYYTSVNTTPNLTAANTTGITHTGADGIQGKNADKQLNDTLSSLSDQLDRIRQGK